MNSYQKIKKWVDEGQLNIVEILAPPRSCSTILERALSNSSSVNLQINDPWAIYDTKEREQKTYDYIYERLKSEMSGSDSITVVIKNIADYIFPGETYQRWLDLCSSSVVMMRTPLESLHSLTIMTIKEISVEYDDSELNEYANKYGRESWKEIISEAKDQDNYSKLSEIFEQYFIQSQEVHKLKLYRSAVVDSLDSVIQNQVFGSASYIQGQTEIFEEDYRKLFLTRIAGWNALWQHVQLLNKSDHRVYYVDATLLRIEPETVLKNLSNKIGLQFSDKMLAWTRSDPFESDYDGAVDYYDKAKTSTSIEPPTNNVFEPESLPEFLQNYLQNQHGPNYMYEKFFEQMVLQFDGQDRGTLLKSVNIYNHKIQLDPTFLNNTQGLLKKEMEK